MIQLDIWSRTKKSDSATLVHTLPVGSQRCGKIKSGYILTRVIDIEKSPINPLVFTSGRMASRVHNKRLAEKRREPYASAMT